MTDDSDKIFLSARELLDDSFVLADTIYQDGLKPDWLIGIWRGGAPVAIALHEYLVYRGLRVKHAPIQAISYTGIAEQESQIMLCGLDELKPKLKSAEKILLVDDVFDTGRSIEAVLKALAGFKLALEIHTAFIWYKPEKNLTALEPDYYLKTTDKWIVFPHELQGLSREEIKNKPLFDNIKQKSVFN